MFSILSSSVLDQTRASSHVFQARNGLLKIVVKLSFRSADLQLLVTSGGFRVVHEQYSPKFERHWSALFIY